MRAFLGRILLATDGKDDIALVTQAARLASKGGSELHVVHVRQSVPTARFGDFIERECELWCREILEWRVDKTREFGIGTVVAHPRMGNTTDAVLELARDIGADLIVVGSRGAGLAGRLILGSVSEEIVYRSHRPVLIVPKSYPASMLSTSQDGASQTIAQPDILMATNDSGPSRMASQYAVRLAETIGAKLSILSVVDEPALFHAGVHRGTVMTELAWAGEAAVAEVVAMANERGVESEELLICGKPHHVIVGVAKELGAKYIVLGSHRSSRLERTLLGSVSKKVLRQAKQPVFVVSRDAIFIA